MLNRRLRAHSCCVVILVVAMAPMAVAAQDHITTVVKRGTFVSKWVEDGNVECAKTLEIRSLVPGQSDGGTAILSLVPEGTFVEPGDLLVELDSSSLEDRRQMIRIEVQQAAAAVNRHKSELESRQLNHAEYVEGVLPAELFDLETEVLAAAFELRIAERELAAVKKDESGNEERIKDAAMAVQLAERMVKLAEMKQSILERFTKPRVIRELEGQVQEAKSQVLAADAEFQNQQARLDEVEGQLANCRIVAPAAGYIVYGSSREGTSRFEPEIEEGALVRERQLLLKICDLSDMEVRFTISEAEASEIVEGSELSVEIDAFPERVWGGRVTDVRRLPARANWRSVEGGSEYEAAVRLSEFPEGLRPGMSAKVSRILRMDDVLMVPATAVLRRGDDGYCLVREDQTWRLKVVRWGPSNGDSTVIEAGLQEGEELVVEPLKHPTGRVEVPPQVGPGENPRETPREDRERTGAQGTFDRLFSSLDKDKNERLEILEIPEALRDSMKKMDANQDGVIDRSEVQAWVEARGNGSNRN